MYAIEMHGGYFNERLGTFGDVPTAYATADEAAEAAQEDVRLGPRVSWRVVYISATQISEPACQRGKSGA